VQVSPRVSQVSTVARVEPAVVVETAVPVALAVPDQTMAKMALVEMAVMLAKPVMAQMAGKVSMR
jgi:hypothetical protein